MRALASDCTMHRHNPNPWFAASASPLAQPHANAASGRPCAKAKPGRTTKDPSPLMVMLHGCGQDAVVFAAVVMHSGVPPGQAHSALSALGAMRGHADVSGGAGGAATLSAPTKPLWPPLLVIHGDADAVVSLHNAHTAIAQWVAVTGAHPQPARVVQRGQRRPMIVTDYVQGRHTVATLAEVAGLCHAWSGGTARWAFSDPKGPDATRLAWAFASKQWMRASHG